MFFGSFEHTIDGKGRVFLPSSIRNQAGATLYIMKGYEGCLSVYLEEDFQKKVEQLKLLPFNQVDVRDVLRLELSSVVELSIDEQGRILIPKKTLAKYGIEKKVIIVGVLDHFEIWSKDHWDNYLNEKEEGFESKAQNLPTKGLE